MINDCIVLLLIYRSWHQHGNRTRTEAIKEKQIWQRFSKTVSSLLLNSSQKHLWKSLGFWLFLIIMLSLSWQNLINSSFQYISEQRRNHMLARLRTDHNQLMCSECLCLHLRLVQNKRNSGLRRKLSIQVMLLHKVRYIQYYK